MVPPIMNAKLQIESFYFLSLLLCTSLLFPAYGQPYQLSRQTLFKKISKHNTNAFLEDSYGFIWIGAGGLFRSDGLSIDPFRPLLNDSTEVSFGRVNTLYEDDHNSIWIGASQGLFRYDRKTDRVVVYDQLNQSLYTRHDGSYGVLSIFMDGSGRLWVGGRQKLYLLDQPSVDSFNIINGIQLGERNQGFLGFTSIQQTSKGTILATSNRGLWLIQNDLTPEQLIPDQWQSIKPEFQVFDVAKDQSGRLWLGTNDGLWSYDPENRAFTKKELPPEVGTIFRAILIDKNNEFWIGSITHGLLHWKNDGTFDLFTKDPNNLYAISDNYIKTLMLDRFQNLWVGTMEGIDRVNFSQEKIPFYQFDPGPDRQNNHISRIIQDSLGGFWFRLMNLGLGYAAGLEEELEILLDPEPNTSLEEIKNFCVDPDGNVWVITLTKGIFLFKKGEKNYQRFGLGKAMQQAYPYCILSDKKNDQYLWFTSKLGLCRLNRFSLEQKWFNPQKDLPWLDGKVMAGIEQSADGNIWFTSRYDRKPQILYFNYDEETFYSLGEKGNQPESFDLGSIFHIKSVPNQKIWIGVRNGLVIIDAISKTYVHLTQQSGLPVKEVRSIIPDLQGTIWFSGDHKICKFDGKGYYCYEGTEGIEAFHYWSATLGRDGRVTFAGSNGFYSFLPNSVRFSEDTIKPKVFLTNVELNYEQAHFDQAYELVKNIEVAHHQNDIRFEFSAPHFLKSDQLKFRYRLSPQKREWIETNSDKRLATYTNLAPGHYTFEVQASHSSGLWPSEKTGLSVGLIIHPPWYKTWWALAIWMGSLVGCLFIFYRFQLNRRLTEAEAYRLRELDQMKTRLYTNITHEFRTPLTLIQGAADNIIRNPKEWAIKGVRMIKRNNQMLLNLVNQMLELAKLESGSSSVHYVQEDIVPFLKYCVESFYSWAQSKDIHLHFFTEVESLVMNYDKEKTQHILYNLLSNAIKFTPNGGTVIMEISALKEQLKLMIRDTGIGIPKDQLDRIFDRFYQVNIKPTQTNTGTGIGLALTKELVSLLDGTIEVKSKINEGTIFYLSFPINQYKVNETAIVRPENLLIPSEGTELEFPNASVPINDQLPLALIVEDNADVVHYIVSCVKDKFRYEVARNGQEGIDHAIVSIPDIIVSDVMMPEKDGYQLCHTLKNDVRTSHIPIILLTAKADTTSRLLGFQQGADAYLNKPFNVKELQIRLNALLEVRQKLQQYYTNPANNQPAAKERYNLEDEFIRKVRDLIEANISDADYGLLQLCRAVGISRSQLFRKLKALTGKSTSAFIRSIRLQKAKELLLNTELNVSEIAYDVGFSSPAYFSKAFSEEFGNTPSKIR